jgi:hypothetical protein
VSNEQRKRREEEHISSIGFERRVSTIIGYGGKFTRLNPCVRKKQMIAIDMGWIGVTRLWTSENCTLGFFWSSVLEYLEESEAEVFKGRWSQREHMDRWSVKRYVEDKDSFRWTTIGSRRTCVRGSDTPEGFTPEVCVCWDLRILKAEVLETMRDVDVKVETQCQIQNSRGKQRRKRSKDLKNISFVDRGGSRRTVDLVVETKVQKREQSHRFRRMHGRRSTISEKSLWKEWEIENWKS